MEHKHVVGSVLSGSIAEELGLEPGDKIISINGNIIEDIFDYQFYSQDEELNVLVETKDGEECMLEIEKDADEDLGIVFDNGLMDNYRSCHNKCIFCFIDQNPPGMRESLYFKDDDSRLSFLQGNYITLTNMSDHDVERIIKYNLSPINISFHTMNPELRCKMLHNRFAGDALKKVDKFYEAGITMNGQIVLCPGWNDGAELEYSIKELMKYLPVLESVSVVPVGLTKFRDGLEKLTTFDAKGCGEVIDLIEKYQKIAYEKYGLHFIHASDEFYIVAGRELPEAERYDGYRQIDNGVGKARLVIDEFNETLERVKAIPGIFDHEERCVSTITGILTSEMTNKQAEALMKEFPWLKVNVYTILNDFYGHGITVTGLLVGNDIINQLKGKDLGQRLYLPENCVRSGDDIFLDDVRVPEVETSLQCGISIVKSSGRDFVYCMLGLDR
jgi:putative radical SAM enzyme (TIGR03279 family)